MQNNNNNNNNCQRCGTPFQQLCPNCCQQNALNNLMADYTLSIVRRIKRWFQVLLFLMAAVLVVLLANFYVQSFTSEENTVSPLKCYATGKGLEVAVAGEISSVNLNIVNQTGKPSTIPVKTLACELVSELTDEIVNCTLQEVDISQYELSYLPTSRGRHQLHIKVEGEHIKGSPFTVTVKMPIHKLGTVLKTITGLKAPQGMTFNQKGEMIVAEYRGHCVTTLSPSGKKLRSFGKEGIGPGDFNHPTDVAVDMDGNILVTDMKNNRIQKFTSDGNFITEVGKHGKGRLNFDFPVGIGVHSVNNKIYIAENKNNRIHILRPDLSFFGYLPSEFNEPKDVAFDSTGNIYVADNEKHRIQVFTANGTLLRQFGKKGKEEGKMSYPSSICIDSTDLVYVVELYNFRVSLFTSEGNFVKSFGTKGKGSGQFDEARGIVVDKEGNIYVSDRVNDRIQQF